MSTVPLRLSFLFSFHTYFSWKEFLSRNKFLDKYYLLHLMQKAVSGASNLSKSNSITYLKKYHILAKNEYFYCRRVKVSCVRIHFRAHLHLRRKEKQQFCFARI